MAKAARTGQETPIEVGPFTGVYDSPDAKAKRHDRLIDLKNGIIPDPTNGSAVVERHGFVGLTTQLGTVSGRTGQLIYTHRRLDGTIDRFMFAGGKMYRWDGDSTATDITPAGVTIDMSNPVFGASYNDSFIVSDETNRPFLYTPATGVATPIDLDGLATEWASKGGPIVYGGDVFMILRALGNSHIACEDGTRLSTDPDGNELTTELLSGQQNTIAWSEPLTPGIGYNQPGFDDLWQLTQTSNEVLGVIVGEEGQLVYYRNKGIGSLTGPVDASFRGSATKDLGSTTVGSDYPAAMQTFDRHHFFLDMDGRVYRFLPGVSAPEELWYPQRRVVEANADLMANRATVLSCARAGYHEGYKLVLFTIWDRQTIYAFDARTGQYVGSWVIGGGIHVDAMGSTVDSNNRSTFVVLGTRTNVRNSTTQGVIWRQKHIDDVNQWLDQPDASVASYLPHDFAAETHWLASDVAASYKMNEVLASLIGDVASHAIGLEYVAPAAGKSNRIVAQSTATVGEKSNADSVAKAAWSLGRNAQGDSLRLRVTVQHSDNVRFGLNSITAKATVTKARIKAA